jgi:hypothetical protein
VPPPRGFLRRPPPLASNTSWGASRAWLEPWPCTGAPLVVPNSVARGQLSNLGRGPAFAPSRLIPGSGPVSQVFGNIRLRIPPPPVSRACLFRRGGKIGAVVGDVVYGYDMGDGHMPNSCEM